MLTSKNADKLVFLVCIACVIAVTISLRQEVSVAAIVSFAFALFGALSYTKCFLYGEEFFVHLYKVSTDQLAMRVFSVILMWALLVFVIFWLL